MESPVNQVSGDGYEPGTAMATAAPPRKVRPGRVWYLVALIAFVGGFAWIVFGLISLTGQVNSFQRVPLPAGGTVRLGHAGGYLVYYEQPTGFGFANRFVSGFDVQVAAASPGAAVGAPRLLVGSVAWQ